METWAIITVTQNGVSKALEVKEKSLKTVDFHIYTLEKYQVKGTLSLNKSFKNLVREVYYKYDVILFIMASGIVVRTIAPLLKAKQLDPAILVMDDKGENIVSLVSGHIGGANNACKLIGALIGARPIITTSSDINGKIAVDTLAIENNLELIDFESAKEITARILNDEQIGLINLSNRKINIELPKNIVLEEQENYSNYQGIIIITEKRQVDLNIPYVQLIPKEIVIGIGCRRGKSAIEIIEFIEDILEELNISSIAIDRLATVDVKEDEEGIIEASRHFNRPLEIISRDHIRVHQDKFKQSPFVMKSIGVGNVSEPCGYIASNKGKILREKIAREGITLSVWKREDNK